MTISYSSKVATSSFSCFLKLLLRWRGSIYRLLWKDFAVFAAMYYILSFIYRFALTGHAKRYFESIARYCETYNNLIPVAFVLGFYVSLVVGRFWEQFQSIPWPSRMAVFVSALVQGNDSRGRLMRRTIMRYLSLTYVITMSSISPGVKKRFPTYQHMLEAGFMLPNELAVFESMKTTYNTYFVPLVWSASLVTRARKEGRIKDDFAVKTLIDEINQYRGKCGSLFGFDWVTVPLVYTQVVTLAVYMFFLSCLMGRQYLEIPETEQFSGDLYFPFFTFLQFFFYMGWLKVAETLLNPFGEDDDDFDINGLIDSNLQQSYLIVDGMHAKHPELIRDQYWDTLDIELPYTEASAQFQRPEHVGSAANIQIPAASSVQLVSSQIARIPEEVEEEGDERDAPGRPTIPLSARSSQTYQDFGKSFGQNFMKQKPKGNLSRTSSRVGSAWNIFARSAMFGRRGRESIVADEDVEKSQPHTPTSLHPMNTRSRVATNLGTSAVSGHEEMMMFELSDDDQSLTAAAGTDLYIINELTSDQTQIDNPSRLDRARSQLSPLRIASHAPLSSSVVPSTAASQAELAQSVHDRAFMDNVLAKLKEIRGDTPPQTCEFNMDRKPSLN